MTSTNICKQLSDIYNEGDKNERCGFVLTDGSILEVKNIHTNPETGFMMSSRDVFDYALSSKAVATWHTHPEAPSSLSADDYVGFQNFPNLKHYIIGQDGLSTYVVENRHVITTS